MIGKNVLRDLAAPSFRSTWYGSAFIDFKSLIMSYQQDELSFAVFHEDSSTG